MKHLQAVGRGIALVILLVSTTAVVAARGPVCVILPVSGEIDSGLATRMISGVEEARAGGNLKHAIVELSPSSSTVRELVRLAEFVFSLRTKGIRTYAFVLRSAQPGAATLLALVSGKIAVAGEARLGGLSRLGLSEGDKKRVLGWGKELGRSATLLRRMFEGTEELAAYRSAATGEWVFLTRGEFENLPDADKTKLVQKEVICHEGEPVFLDALKAHRFGVAQYVVSDRTELLLRLGLTDLKEADFQRIGGGGVFGGEGKGSAFAEFFQKPFVRFILILGGILCLFLEFQIPGFGLPGLLGLLCFAVFFGTGLVTGYVNVYELIVFIISVVLIGLELLVIPGFGVAGILGIGGLLVSLVLAMYRGGGSTFDWEELSGGLLTTFLSIACAMVSIYVCAKYLPKNLFVRRAGLVHEAVIGGDARPGTPPAQGDSRSAGWPVGEEGVAVTGLRPAGKARVGGKLLDVVAEADFIEAGTPIVVVRKVGPRTVVRPQREEEPHA